MGDKHGGIKMIDWIFRIVIGVVIAGVGYVCGHTDGYSEAIVDTMRKTFEEIADSASRKKG